MNSYGIRESDIKVIVKLSFTRVHEEFTMNTLSISRIHLDFTFYRLITINSLSFSRFNFEITILFPKSPSIYYLFREMNMNSLSASWFNNEFTVCFANSLSINFFRRITMDSLSVSRFYYEKVVDSSRICEKDSQFSK